jgi:hypothetical protein
VHLTTKYLSFLFLTAALTASVAPKAASAQEVVVTTGGDHNRYYDRHHHDYHQWNDGEDRSYRVYLGERHRAITGIGAIAIQIATSSIVN